MDYVMLWDGVVCDVVGVEGVEVGVGWCWVG